MRRMGMLQVLLDITIVDTHDMFLITNCGKRPARDTKQETHHLDISAETLGQLACNVCTG